jgi:hypothetical protein
MIQAVVIFCLIGYFSGSIGSFNLAKPKIAKTFDWLTAGFACRWASDWPLTERGMRVYAHTPCLDKP